MHITNEIVDINWLEQVIITLSYLIILGCINWRSRGRYRKPTEATQGKDTEKWENSKYIQM